MMQPPHDEKDRARHRNVVKDPIAVLIHVKCVEADLVSVCCVVTLSCARVARKPSPFRVSIFLMSFPRGISTVQHVRLRMHRDDNI